MKRSTQILLVSAFALWLGAPLVAALLGVRSGFTDLLKRGPAELPSVSWKSWLDAEFYAGIAAAYGDRIPFRVAAVGLDTTIDLDLFGDSPNPAVLLGSDGWLFQHQSVVRRCNNSAAVERAVTTIRETSRVLQASGRRLVFLVAPDKRSIYPERLGAAGALVECGAAETAELRRAFAAAEVPGYLDLWTALEELKRTSDEDIYWPRDTHWTSASAVEVSRRIVDQLRLGLWDASAVDRQSTHRHPGDLARMTGRRASDEGTLHRVRRNAKVKVVERKPKKLRRLALVGRVPKFSRPVLSIYDSFGAKYIGIVSQYLKNSTWISWRSVPKARLSHVVEEFAAAKVVVLQSVERSVLGRFAARSRNLPSHLVGKLLPELPTVELVPRQETLQEVLRTDELVDLPASATGLRYLVADFAEAVGLRRIRVDAEVAGSWLASERYAVSETRLVVVLPQGASRARLRLPRAQNEALRLTAVFLVDPSKKRQPADSN